MSRLLGSRSRATLFGLSTAAVLLPAGAAAAAAPQVTGLSRLDAYNGTVDITISGHGFTGATAVKFGSSNFQSFTVVSDSTITARAPLFGPSTPPSHVTVTTAEGTSPTTALDVVTVLVGPQSLADTSIPVTCTYTNGGGSFDAVLNSRLLPEGTVPRNVLPVPPNAAVKFANYTAYLRVPDGSKTGLNGGPFIAVESVTNSAISVDVTGATTTSANLVGPGPHFTYPVAGSADGNQVAFNVANDGPLTLTTGAAGTPLTVAFRGLHGYVKLANGVESLVAVTLDCLPQAGADRTLFTTSVQDPTPTPTPPPGPVPTDPRTALPTYPSTAFDSPPPTPRTAIPTPRTPTPTYPSTAFDSPPPTPRTAIPTPRTPTPTYPSTANDSPQPTPPPVPTPSGDPSGSFAITGSATLKTLTKGTLPISGSAVASLNTATGAVSADLTFAQSTGKLVALGILPVVAKVAIVPQGSATGQLTDDGKLTLTTKVRIKLPSVTLLGVQLAGGAGCQAKNVTAVALKSTGAFSPDTGGSLAGTFTISDLVNCGGLTGLVSPLTAGTGNAIALKLTPAA